jgi:hypothetical protein
MITSISQCSKITQLDRSNLPSYWADYFEYEKDSTLYDLTKSELVGAVEIARNKIKQFIDSQQVINKILTECGSKHNFHRQFNERHKGLNAGTVLGMQLYHIMIEDSDVWMYYETQHPGHLFPHATYFIVKEKEVEDTPANKQVK